MSKSARHALLVANLVPLAGVLLLGWDVGNIMLVYWAESALIGVFNLLKLAVIGPWASLLYGPFFVGHFGAFMAVHLLFVYAFFVHDPHGMGPIPINEVLHSLRLLWPALVGLSLSHALSFVQNFLKRGEYRATTMAKQMAAPYQRVVVMHVTIILGALLALLTHSVLPALCLLIVLKTLVDLHAHQRERDRYVN